MPHMNSGCPGHQFGDGQCINRSVYKLLTRKHPTAPLSWGMQLVNLCTWAACILEYSGMASGDQAGDVAGGMWRVMWPLVCLPVVNLSLLNWNVVCSLCGF